MASSMLRNQRRAQDLLMGVTALAARRFARRRLLGGSIRVARIHRRVR